MKAIVQTKFLNAFLFIQMHFLLKKFIVFRNSQKFASSGPIDYK